jgi:AraC-like DNA-binding protein
MSILFFDDINASHAATGYRGWTDLPDFHVFTVEDTYPDTRQVMPPYRFGFYQMVLLENSGDAALNMNAEPVGDLSDTLTFASPEHVLAWIRGEAQRGYILYFKDAFLAHYPAAVQDEFPFFRLTDINLLRVGQHDKPAMYGHFERLLTLFQSQHPYRVQMLQACLLALLYDCKRLYDAQRQAMKDIPRRRELVLRYRQFVNQHYLSRKTVEAYAELLAVSPDYLSQTVKAVTGKNAHSLIAERILLEAKKLLTYSDLNIAEIADYLGYAEPTHFGRFFRRYTGISPLAWRQRRGAEIGHFSPETG